MRKNYLLLTCGILLTQAGHAMWTEDKNGNTIKAPNRKEVLNVVDVRIIKIVDKKTIKPIKPTGVAKITTASLKDTGRPIAGQTNEDVACLAYSIYREAGNLPVHDQYAVGQVHINRVRDGSWGRTLCKVVYAKAQFSWTLEKKLVNWSVKQKAKFIAMAQSLVDGIRVKSLDNDRVLWYHADYVNPKWANKNKIVAQAGPHIFYRDIPH